MLFAFAHGIRLTLDSLGLSFDDEDVMQTILEKMDDIVGNAKHSLVRGHDDFPDWEEFRRLRKIEQKLCFTYLKETVAQSKEDAGNDQRSEQESP